MPTASTPTLDGFARWLTKQGYAATTITGYVRSVQRWQRAGTEPAAWLAREQARSGTPPTATVLRHRSALVRWLEYTGQPTELHLPRVLRRSRPRPAHVVTATEDAALSTALFDSSREPQASVARLLRATGLRISEALALRLADVEVVEGVVVLQVRRSKTGKPRTVPLTAQAAAELSAYLRGDRADSSSQWLFPSPQNAQRAISAEAVRRFFREELRPAVGGAVHPHALRHRVETLLLEAGIGGKVAEDLQGHTAATARGYQHPSVQTLQEALEAAQRRRR